MNGAFVDNYPEKAMVLAPRPMPVCGESFIASHESNNNHRGKPISGGFAEFINVGQTLVFLNKSIPILPGGGYYSIKNPCFQATWTFHAVNSPPATDSKITQAGNNLVIIIHQNPDSVADLKQPAASVSLGSVTVSTTPATATPATMDFDYTLAGFSIASGKKRVRIYNLGGTVGAGAFATITVNGKTLHPDGIPLEFPLSDNDDNTAANTFATSPALTVVNAGGAMVRWETEDL